MTESRKLRYLMSEQEFLLLSEDVSVDQESLKDRLQEIDAKLDELSDSVDECEKYHLNITDKS